MDIKSFKNIFDKQFSTCLDANIQHAKDTIDHPRLNLFLEHIHTYVFGGGKRIRPYVLYLTYMGFGGKNEEEILKLGNVFELIHAMLLVHDDVIDQAEKRHNVLSMHACINQHIKNKHVAEGQAIVIGDLMASWALERLYQSYDFEKENLIQARKNVHTLLNEVCLGQMVDVDCMTGIEIDNSILEKKNLFKTASYTFIRPMLTGAILAGVNEEQQSLIQDLGKNLGLAFQVRDDLKDIFATEVDKRTFSDIQEGQQTYFTQYIYTKGTDEQKKFLKSRMGRVLNSEEISALQNIFEISGAIDAGKQLIETYGKKSIEILNTISFTNQESVKYFVYLIEKLTSLEI